MEKFPVINSTLSPKHLAISLNDYYDFEAFLDCQLIRAALNDTYLLSNLDEKYIFRMYKNNWRSKVEIQEEIQFLNALKANNISVSYPIPDSKGQFIQAFNAPEGNRYGVLFSFAEGEKILNFPKEIHYKIGQEMARIHQLSEKKSLKRVSYSSKVLVEDPLNEIAKFLSKDSEEISFMHSTQVFLLNEFSNWEKQNLRKGIVHLDIWADNLNVTRDGKITIFDFDFCGNGWLCLDLAYYIMQLFRLENDEKERFKKINSFYEGYESILEIPKKEKMILPILGVSLYFFYLGIQCRRFENWSNVFLNETYLKRYINQIVKPYFKSQNHKNEH